MNDYNKFILEKKAGPKPSLFNKTFSQNANIQNPPDDIKSKINNNLGKNESMVNLLSSKTNFINPQDFKIIPETPEKRKTCSFTVRNKLLFSKNKSKDDNFNKCNFIPNKKEFYLTAAMNDIIKKNKIKNCNSTKNLKVNDCKKNNMIDIIHEKEIQLCLDLIKILPEKTQAKRKNKSKENIRDLKTIEKNNLIKLIKTFNIDSFKSQRLMEEKILNNTLINSEFNPLNTLSVSLSTNYKTNMMPLNSFYKFDVNNYNNNNKKFNNSSITFKNNISTIKKINESSLLNNNNNSGINSNLTRSKLIKSINNKINNSKVSSHGIYSKMIYDPKSEINFHTGFVRSQKNIYDDVYSKYFKNSKKNEIRVKNFRKKKEEANKLSLPEIEEYKKIIKDIENRKSKAFRKSQSTLDIHKDKNDLVLKDQLIEELHNIYQGQKNTFINNLKDNFGDHEQMEVDSYKKEINENIKKINKMKRMPNCFVDGYSLFDGKINKKIKEYNYILGNKFHDKEQKEEKAIKFHEIYEEFENSINNNKQELINKKQIYKQIFMPKIDFKKDKNTKFDNDVKIDPKNYKYYILNGNIIMASNKTNKIDKPISSNTSKKNEKIYNEYINFKNEYKKKYLLD